MTLLSNEVPYDRDGTMAILCDQNSLPLADISAMLTDLRSTEVQHSQTWNDPQGAIVYFYFAEPFDLSEFALMQPVGTTNPKCHFSTNSVAPGTGSWFDWSTGSATASPLTAADGTNVATIQQFSVGNNPGVIPAFHASADGVTALRVRISSSAGDTRRYLHFRIWGLPSSATSYLALWDDSLDQPAAADLFDLGTITTGVPETVDFRIKNLHPTAQVDNVTLSIPDAVAWSNMASGGTEFDDGGGFAHPLNIGSIAADTISGVITMRRTAALADPLDAGWALGSLLLDGAWA